MDRDLYFPELRRQYGVLFEFEQAKDTSSRRNKVGKHAVAEPNSCISPLRTSIEKVFAWS